MSEIRAKTDDRKLILTSRPILTSGSKNTDTFCVVFDDTWKFNKAVYYANFFKKDSTQGYVRQLNYSFGSYSCDVPDLILTEEGSFSVGVYACNPSDVVKTSSIMAYDVIRGVPVTTANIIQYTADEVKDFFVHLINANNAIALNNEMSLGDISLSYSTYSDSEKSYISAFSDFADRIYNIIIKYINSRYRKVEDVVQASIKYPVTISDYLEMKKFKPDSTEDDLIKYEDLKSKIYSVISTYIKPEGFDSSTDTIMYPFIIEDYIQQLRSKQTAVITSMQNLYLGGTPNA